jgi:hypothetical protein
MGRQLIYLVLAFFATHGQWQCFISFQSKGKLDPKTVYSRAARLIFFTLIVPLKFVRPI